MAMKHGRLKHHQRRLRLVRPGDLLVVAPHTRFQRIQREPRFLPVARKHIERYLLIEHVLGQRLERQQIDGLLM